MKIIIATIKSWNIENALKIQKKLRNVHEIKIIDQKEDLKIDEIKAFDPDYIFFPHWSYIIKEEIFRSFTCVVFHMTDLPYGRGGSPLQNLIVRGHKTTKISAIQVTKELDAGPIFKKEELSLEGSAEEIYQRASEIIFSKMIPAILTDRPEPIPQIGEVITFLRRKPEQSQLLPDMELKTIYDCIRMLDAEGYPNAYLMFGDKKLTFSKADFKDGKITAQVEWEVSRKQM